MTWETRGKKRFLYITRRQGDEFAREYIGAGPVADVADKIAALGRSQRKVIDRAAEDERTRRQRIDALLDELENWTICLSDADRAVASCYQRQPERRLSRMDAHPKACSVEKTTIEVLRKATAAANAGDRDALAQLRRLLDANDEIWRHVADLVDRAETALIEQAAGGEKLLTESLRRKVAAMKSDLVGDSALPLERLLVERIVATWLHVQIAEISLAAASNQKAKDSWRRTLNAANKTHVSAIKLLTEVREPTRLKMARP